MKLIDRKKLNYIIYLIVVITLIFVAFNIYFTIKIHRQLVEVAESPGRYPPGAFIFDPEIGFDFASNISSPAKDGGFYVKSHKLGFRIAEHDNPVSLIPGGVMSLGCSFTYGDQINSEETFTQLAADRLMKPAYNYGVSAFSYVHAILKARKLKEDGILEKIKPTYLILGCWKGLPDRSRSPFPPTENNKFPLTAAYLTLIDEEPQIQPPLRIEHAFKMVDQYRIEGSRLTFNRFLSIFIKAPEYVYFQLKHNLLHRKKKEGNLESNLSDYMLYDYYFTEIEEIFSPYRTRIIVLYMPIRPNEQVGGALKRAIAKHQEITFVNGSDAIRKHDVPVKDYQTRHPLQSAHKAYAAEIVEKIYKQRRRQ